MALDAIGLASFSLGMPNSPGGSSTPLRANWAMKVGRWPVETSSPSILPSSRTPVCLNSKMSWVRISSSSIP